MSLPVMPGAGFPRGIDVGDHENVSTDKPVSEVLPERRRSAVAMRLEDAHDAFPSAVGGGGKRSLDLGRQMRVVVDEGHPVDLASELEAPSDTAEPGECCGSGGGRTTAAIVATKAACVAGVVHARGRQLARVTSAPSCRIVKATDARPVSMSTMR